MTALTGREASTVANCESLLERLKSVIEEEITALEQHGTVQPGQFSERKNQLLRELLIAQRTCNSTRVLQELAPKSREVQLHLSRNQRLLKAHTDAVKEVSAIIVDSIRQGDSDGTYSRSQRG